MQALTIEIFSAATGEASAKLLKADGSSLLLHSAINPRQEILDYGTPEIWADHIVCLGTGLGYHLEFLQNIQESKRIYLCSAFPELLQASQARLQGGIHQVQSIPMNGSNILVPLLTGTVQFLRHPAEFQAYANRFQKLAHDILQPQVQAKLNLQESETRVMLFYGHHFLEEELVLALLEEGIAFRKFVYGKENWERVFQEFRPTHLLTINLKGIDREGRILESARNWGCQVHTWFVDDPRPIALALPKAHFSEIHAWCWERHYLKWLGVQNFASQQWLPLAGAPQIFYPLAQSAKISGPVFVGSSMGEKDLSRIRKSFLWQANLEPLVRRFASAVQRQELQPLELESLQENPFADERNKTWFTSLVLHTASHAKRLELLRTLQSCNVSCVGDALGWQTLLGANGRLYGDVEYRTGLNAYYQKGAIQINSTSCQMPTAVNQRVFDVPLAGGILISDIQNDVLELFAEDCRLLYRTPIEALEIVQNVMEDPEFAQKINLRAREAILDTHTYRHRLRQIFAK